VTRLQALEEVNASHRDRARSILTHIEALIPEARTMDSVAKIKLMERISGELDVSKQLLERHAQGLLGSDLAELRMVKAEHKQMIVKMNKMNKQYTTQLGALNAKLRTSTDDQGIAQEVVKSVGNNDYEPMAYMCAEQRSCMMAILEEKLQALFSDNPELESRTNKIEMARLEDAFKKERMAALEKQVAHLTEDTAATRRTMAILQAQKDQIHMELDRALRENEELVQHLSGSKKESGWRQAGSREGAPSTEDDNRSNNTLNSGTSGRSTPQDSEAFSPAMPEGRPKAGRPMRQGRTTTGGGTSEQESPATGVLQPPIGNSISMGKNAESVLQPPVGKSISLGSKAERFESQHNRLSTQPSTSRSEAESRHSPRPDEAGGLRQEEPPLNKTAIAFEQN